MEMGDEEIYQKHSADLMRLARMLVGPAHAHDVFTDAVLSAMRAAKWRSLDDDAKGGYLYRSVVNQAKQWGRSQSRRARREALFAAREYRPDSSAVTDPDLEVWECIANLSERQRAVIFLTYWSDLDGRTVAERLGISEGSVRRHLHVARRRLEGRLHV